MTDTENGMTWEKVIQKRLESWMPHRKVSALTRLRREAKRDAFPRVRVAHPDHGEVIVRGESKNDAIHQAALAWGVEYLAVSGCAQVWRLEEP